MSYLCLYSIIYDDIDGVTYPIDRYQKTESVIKSTAEKTTSILGGITAGVSHKLGQMRNSESFRSIEERVGTAYENVKV